MAQQSPRRVATIIWGALLAGVTSFVGIALYVVVGLRGGSGIGVGIDAAPLLAASLALSVATVAASWRWAVRMRMPAPRGDAPASARPAPYPPGPEADAVTRLIVACALCEGGALFAVVAFLLTGSPLALITFALSWFAIAAHFPGDRHWARLVGTPQRAVNRMIRG